VLSTSCERPRPPSRDRRQIRVLAKVSSSIAFFLTCLRIKLGLISTFAIMEAGCRGLRQCRRTNQSAAFDVQWVQTSKHDDLTMLHYLLMFSCFVNVSIPSDAPLRSQQDYDYDGGYWLAWFTTRSSECMQAMGPRPI
jgi:hypothetical protein